MTPQSRMKITDAEKLQVMFKALDETINWDSEKRTLNTSHLVDVLVDNKATVADTTAIMECYSGATGECLGMTETSQQETIATCVNHINEVVAQ